MGSEGPRETKVDCTLIKSVNNLESASIEYAPYHVNKVKEALYSELRSFKITGEIPMLPRSEIKNEVTVCLVIERSGESHWEIGVISFGHAE